MHIWLKLGGYWRIQLDKMVTLRKTIVLVVKVPKKKKKKSTPLPPHPPPPTPYLLSSGDHFSPIISNPL